MSIWWLLWFVLSFILLGTTAWSLVILYKQKKAWAAFAKKKGLVFTKNKFSEPCSMEGTIGEFNLSFFTAVQQKEDARKNRQLTVIQITLPKPFIDAMGAGTDEMLPFFNSLDMLSPHAVKSDQWNSKINHLFSRNKAAVDLFLTDERIAIISKILKLANSDNIVLLNDEEGVFRFETSNPLTEADMIEKLTTKLMAYIKKLQPTDKEIAIFNKAIKKKPKKVVEEEAVESEASKEDKPKDENAEDKNPEDENAEGNASKDDA